MGSRSEPCETKEKGSRAARSATHLQCELVLAQVDGVSLLELAAEVLEQADVEIFAAEKSVSVLKETHFICVNAVRKRIVSIPYGITVRHLQMT